VRAKSQSVKRFPNFQRDSRIKNSSIKSRIRGMGIMLPITEISTTSGQGSLKSRMPMGMAPLSSTMGSMEISSTIRAGLRP